MSELQPQDGAASEMEIAAARAVAAGDLTLALRSLQAAVAERPDRLAPRMNLAAVRRRAGDLPGALAAVDGALTVAPRDFAALLLRASLLERSARGSEAAIAYGVALAQAPDDLATLNPSARKAAEHARGVYDRHQAERAAALDAVVQPAFAEAGEEAAWRLRGFLQEVNGRAKRYRQEPSAFCYPGLPAIPYWPRDRFPWLAGLEAATEAIAAELDALLGGPGFQPYVDYPDSLPLDQWRGLNRSPDWSAFHLLFNGSPAAGNAERCPRTLAALARTPQPKLPGRSPAAMFSVLRPHTRIPPHTGVSNTRLVCHLPLIVPPGCRFRVGDQTREWRRGEAWVFDDTIEHEAVNDSDEDRIILIFDVRQPFITPSEEAAISRIAETLDAFGGGPILAGL